MATGCVASFEGLGDLQGGGENSAPTGVSADGSVVVGWGSSPDSTPFEAFRWQDGKMLGLGDLPGSRFNSFANGVSGDGSVVVGGSSSFENDLETEAFRWTEDMGMVGMGVLEGDLASNAFGASADGSVVIGYSTVASIGGAEAFRWTEAEGMVGLGDLPGALDFSRAIAVSADGRVIVGDSSGNVEGQEAFRWTEEGGMVGLGELLGGIYYSVAKAVSADGFVVVGDSDSDNGAEAFRWTEEEGMVGLGDLPGNIFYSEAYGVSGDGAVVVGLGHGGGPTDARSAFIWTQEAGMRDLRDVLVNEHGLDLSGWSLSYAAAISTDGTTIVGRGISPRTRFEAWKAVVPRQPCKGLVFEPASLDLGDVEVGTSSGPQTATLRNVGTEDVTGLDFGVPGGGFEVDAGACGDGLPAQEICEITVTFMPPEAGPAAGVLQVTEDQGSSAVLKLSGRGVVPSAVLTPIALRVDPSQRSSDGNGVFEPGEQVEVSPSWRNDGELAQSLTGTASGFGGPAGAIYTLVEDGADYGLLQPGQAASCRETGVCYVMGLDDPAVRPAPHWDAFFDETLDDGAGTTEAWALHVGDSFTDVPRSSLFYRSIETLLHAGVTAGCSANAYCPAGSHTRDQMAVFMLRAVEADDYVPPACVEGEELFVDVPFDDTFCPWIEELAARGVTSGCDGSHYCPSAPVTRAQMAVFLLKTLEGDGYTPPACTGVFVDVPCPSTFADWIEELEARGITGGCSSEPLAYCPGTPVTREQMAAFITRAFALTLY